MRGKTYRAQYQLIICSTASHRPLRNGAGNRYGASYWPTTHSPRPDQGPYAPQGSTSLLPKVVSDFESKRSNFGFTFEVAKTQLLEFTSPVDREYMRRRRKFRWIENVGSTGFERRLHFRSFRLPYGAYGPRISEQSCTREWAMFVFPLPARGIAASASSSCNTTSREGAEEIGDVSKLIIWWFTCSGPARPPQGTLVRHRGGVDKRDRIGTLGAHRQQSRTEKDFSLHTAHRLTSPNSSSLSPPPSPLSCPPPPPFPSPTVQTLRDSSEVN